MYHLQTTNRLSPQGPHKTQIKILNEQHHILR
jgi:hypothetical protein